MKYKGSLVKGVEVIKRDKVVRGLKRMVIRLVRYRDGVSLMITNQLFVGHNPIDH